MDKQKRKKMIYVPGIISLIVLPVLFLVWSRKQFDKKQLTVLSIILADTNQFKKHPEMFDTLNNEFPPKRNYLDICYTGNNIDDKIKLDFARLQIKDYVTKMDYQNGIRFKFGDSCEYWTFIKTVDALKDEGAKTFMPIDNDIWFFNIKPDTTIQPLNYDCLLCDDVIYIEPEITLWTIFFAKLKIIWKNSWAIIVAFCSFVFSVWFIRRKKNGSQY
jgi:hypothetical protein